MRGGGARPDRGGATDPASSLRAHPHGLAVGVRHLRLLDALLGRLIARRRQLELRVCLLLRVRVAVLVQLRLLHDTAAEHGRSG